MTVQSRYGVTATTTKELPLTSDTFKEITKWFGETMEILYRPVELSIHRDVTRKVVVATITVPVYTGDHVIPHGKHALSDHPLSGQTVRVVDVANNWIGVALDTGVQRGTNLNGFDLEILPLDTEQYWW